MRRIFLLLAVAAALVMMLVASAMPAFGAVNSKTTQTTGATQNANNCQGSGSSGFSSTGGTDNPGGLNPGSAKNPDTNFTNPATGGTTFNGDFTSTVAKDPSLIGGTGQGVGQFQPNKDPSCR
jgi:hypothetical protein